MVSALARFYVAATIGIGLSLSGSMSARQPPTPDTPATAGSIALLASNMDAAAVEKLIRAIAADEALVRTVAARIAAVTAHPPYGNAILTAWQREEDPVAAAEQVRAMLSIRGALAREVIDARLDSSSPAVVRVYAEWLSRNQPQQFVQLLPRLVARLPGDRSDITRYLKTVLDTRPDLAEPLLRAWLGAGAPASWRPLADHVSFELGQLTAILIDALSSKEPAIRQATVWSLLARVVRRPELPQALLDAALPRTGSDATAPDDVAMTWEQLGREMLARRLGRTAAVDRSAFLAAHASNHVADSRVLAGLAQVTERERDALKAALGDQFPKPTAPGATTPGVRSGAAMRTMPAPWPGFLKSLFEAAECAAKPKSPAGIASASYRADGAVAKLSISTTGVSRGCRDAVEALARLTLADASYPPAAGGSELLVLPLDPAHLECASLDPPDGLVPENIGDKIKPPRKTRDVRPDYPDALRKARVQGQVVLQGVVGRSGCITALRVLRGVDPPMDFAALHAASGWRFTPSYLDGRAVPVVMTVTLNFSLK